MAEKVQAGATAALMMRKSAGHCHVARRRARVVYALRIFKPPRRPRATWSSPRRLAPGLCRANGQHRLTGSGPNRFDLHSGVADDCQNAELARLVGDFGYRTSSRQMSLRGSQRSLQDLRRFASGSLRPRRHEQKPGSSTISSRRPHDVPHSPGRRVMAAICAKDTAGVGRVEVWRGGCRSSMSVPAPFVWRCLIY